MNKLELSVQDIKNLMEAFRQSGLGSFHLQEGDLSLKLENAIVAAPQTATTSEIVSATATTSIETKEVASGHVVTAPIVGTFYASPSPDKPPYVSVGSKVSKGDVLFIIESMKLMNEITSEYDGTVTEILVCNEQGVEYGQPILRIG